MRTTPPIDLATRTVARAREIRLAYRLTQGECARVAGLKAPAICDAERGRRPLSIVQARAYLAAVRELASALDALRVRLDVLERNGGGES